jgi:hypothetical protein
MSDGRPGGKPAAQRVLNESNDQSTATTLLFKEREDLECDYLSGPVVTEMEMV